MNPSSSRDTVVLVDPDGGAIGSAPKLAAHAPPGLLHLAISVFLYRSDGELLMQRRALSKYHFPGVWANACCSHPRPGEPAERAAVARVREELGLDVALRFAGALTYRAPCPVTGLVEHEYDCVYYGESDDEPRPDPSEVAETRFFPVTEVCSGTFPGTLAPWFLPALDLVENSRAGVTSP